MHDHGMRKEKGVLEGIMGFLSARILLFVGFLVGGLIILVNLKNVSVSTFIAATAIWMFGYYIALHMFGCKKTTHEDKADSIYYLGLLMTLCTLMMSFMEFHDNIDDGIAMIISLFGVALSSTVMGLVLRMVYISVHVQPEETLEESVVHIDTLMWTLKENIHKASLELEHSIKNSSNVLQNAYKGLAADANGSNDAFMQAKANIEKVSKDFATNLGAAGNQLISAHENFAGKINSFDPVAVLSENLEPITNILKEQVVEVETAFSSLNGGIQKAQMTMVENISSFNPASEFSGRLQPVIDLLKVQVKSLQSSFDGLADTLNTQSDKLGSAIENTTKFGEGIENITKVVRYIGESVVKLQQPIDKINVAVNSMDSLTDSMVSLGSALKNGTSVSGLWVKETEGQVNSLRNMKTATEELNSALNESVSEIATNAEKILKDLSISIEGLAGMVRNAA